MSIDENILPFWGGGEIPVQYFLSFNEHEYYVRYRSGLISVEIDNFEEVFHQQIGDEWDGSWTDEETNVYLFEISQAIRANSFATLKLPTLYEARSHEQYKKGSLPNVMVGLRCKVHSKQVDRSTNPHQHTIECYIHVAACDVEQWIEAHPEEHEALRIDLPNMWKFYAGLQASTVDNQNKRHYPNSDS